MAARKILVVDDEAEFSQMISDYFKPKGYTVYASTNLEDTLNIFRKEKPRVVLLDFNMPIISGEKFLPILQSIEPMVRAIVVTGYLQEEVEEKFKGLGYFAFFKKGDLSLEVLQAKVDEALSY